MSKVSISIEYAGLQLPIAKNEKGEDVTPLKPISDLFGLQWRGQYKKVTESTFLSRFLGISTVSMHHGSGQNREQICILLSRVEAFLVSINPNQVRAQGNESSADFLEQKIKEWINTIKDLEETRTTFDISHARSQEALRKQRATLSEIIRIKDNISNLEDKFALEYVVKQMAGELGIPYQSDLLEEQP